MEAEPGLVGQHILAPARVGEGRGPGRPSGCLSCSRLRISEVPMISCISIVSWCPGMAQLLSPGVGSILWEVHGLCKERWCPASILVPPLLACWCWGLGLWLVVLPQLQQLSGRWAAPGSAAGSKLGGEVGGGSWPPWAPHLTAEVPRGFSELRCERTSCWRGQPADLLCPAAHWRCLEDDALWIETGPPFPNIFCAGICAAT